MNQRCSICQREFESSLPCNTCAACFDEFSPPVPVPEPKHIEHQVEDHGFRLRGDVRVQIHDAKTGELLDDYVNGNLITNAGLNLARDLLGSGNYCISHIAVGTDTTPPAVTDVALGTEVFRNSLTLIDFDPGGIVQFSLFLDTGDANGFTLEEAGLFNAFNVGDMFSRVLLVPNIDKDASITVTISWNITVERA